jgi:hypothetical protein
MSFLIENYKLNFRPANEISTDGLGNVYFIGFYVILYVWVHALR